VSRPDLRVTVADVLSGVCAHRRVPFEVNRVDVGESGLRIEITLHYRCADRVCCGEPGCYVPFLGLRRRQVPGALARQLGREVAPRVSMTVHLRHEAGYAYIDLATGETRGPGTDSTIEYNETHFA
jgi:hypothetical protein